MYQSRTRRSSIVESIDYAGPAGAHDPVDTSPQIPDDRVPVGKPGFDETIMQVSDGSTRLLRQVQLHRCQHAVPPIFEIFALIVCAFGLPRLNRVRIECHNMDGCDL